MAHALLNTTVIGMYLASLGLRAARQREGGRVLAASAFGLLLLSGMLGGEMVYNMGVNVTHLLFPRPPAPDQFTDVLASSDLPKDKVVVVEVERVPVMLLRTDETIYAVETWCPHAGGELQYGELSNETVTCPLHGSRFRLSDGCPLNGPASSPLRTFEVREQHGRVAVRPSYEGKHWPSAPTPPEIEHLRLAKQNGSQ
ncbi:MAG: Rieske (2Fe-2S) protein [Chloroflexaceae bacterium]|nr:Rieske (2Fe-2S) protein [Chloroflexaceae bacterium]